MTATNMMVSTSLTPVCHRRCHSTSKAIFLITISLPLVVVSSFVTTTDGIQTRSRLRQPFLPSTTTSASRRTSSTSSHLLHATTPSLLPEENPQADLSQPSKSGVVYATVVNGIHELYPPAGLEQRNAASRTDGYWPFIQKGEDPPQQLTYGEFDLPFFATLLDKAHEYYNEGSNSDGKQEDWSDKVFCDIGSGTGRLVLAAAALHPGFQKCRGIELLNSIHVVAQESLAKCHVDYGRWQQKEEAEAPPPPVESSSLVGEKDWLNQFQGQFMLHDFIDGEEDEEEYDDEEEINDKEEEIVADEVVATDDEAPPIEEEDQITHYLPIPTPDESNNVENRLPLAPIDLKCGSFDAVYFGDSDVIFCFSSCMSSSIIGSLSKAIGRQCKPGTIVITTEFPLQLTGMIDPTDDPEEEKYVHCQNYKNSDFDDPDDAAEWIKFCDEEGIESQQPFQFDLLESIDGYCWLTGGLSTAHIHRVVKSAWHEESDAAAAAAEGDALSIEEKAAMAWIYAQKQPTDDFYRDVRNNMVYHGFSESWYKDLVDE